ncbi:MAG: GLUG motif-containing protein, partial [Planctomycetota bacterium]
MTMARNSRVLRTIPLLIAVGLFSYPAYAKYSGGTGEPNDPYQIATAEDLMLLGETPEDYDKHFILTADIDLDPNLPGRKVFNRALIAPDTNDVEDWFQGTPFTGFFCGNGHTISRLTIIGDSYLGLFGPLGSGALISDLGLEEVDVNGFGDYVGGLAGINRGSITTSYSTGTVSGSSPLGGLVGTNSGSITMSYSAGAVNGDWDVGGLVGYNGGLITGSYSAGAVNGDSDVGGLVGYNGDLITGSYSTGTVSGSSFVGGLVGSSYRGSISTGTVSGVECVGGLVGYTMGSTTMCYSAAMVSGDQHVSGLAGCEDPSSVAASFWDIETSGQVGSDGGTGLTTAAMQEIDTFLSEGWDFVGEIRNGTCHYWQISPGDYPRLRYHVGGGPMMPEGLGTAEEPYLIRDVRDLGTLWFRPMSHYRLEASINLSGIKWSIAVVP